MKSPLFTGIVFILLLTNYSIAQSTSRTYVRVVVQDANTLEAATQIDQFIRTQNGVITSRMDRRTGLYFGIFETNSGISSQDFLNWIQSLGFTTTCYVNGTHGIGEPVKKIKREDCIQNSLLHEN